MSRSSVGREAEVGLRVKSLARGGGDEPQEQFTNACAVGVPLSQPDGWKCSARYRSTANSTSACLAQKFHSRCAVR